MGFIVDSRADLKDNCNQENYIDVLIGGTFVRENACASKDTTVKELFRYAHCPYENAMITVNGSLAKIEDRVGDFHVESGERLYIMAVCKTVNDETEENNKDEEKVITPIIEEKPKKSRRRADFYAVQVEVDGFGNDTCTLATFKTKKEAQEYVKTHDLSWAGCWSSEPVSIVPQNFGEYKSIYH